MDKLIKKELKDLVVQEETILEWIKKFLTEKWLEEENERISEFESIEKNIEGFGDDPYIEKKITMPRHNIDSSKLEDHEIIIKEPPEDRKMVQNAIQRVVPKYAEKARNMLGKAKENWKALNLPEKNPKKILKLIAKKFSKFWDYLLYLRSAYVDIFNTILKFDFSPTIKFLITTIYQDLYDLDLQFWYRDEIFGFKNVIKLLSDEL